MRTLLRCPYGHDAPVEAVTIEKGSYGTEHPMGLRCGQCGRVFVKEFKVIVDYWDAWEAPGGSHIWSSPMYEIDGPWTGDMLTIVTVQE